jgi:dipeptidase
MGYYEGNDEDFSFSDTYAPVSFGGARFCEIRVWSFFRSIKSDMDEYFGYASGRDIRHDKKFEDGRKNPNGYATNRMPLWIKPDEKIDVHHVMNGMRDHLEGTELDMRKDIGAGPFENPYRWRPLTWKVDDVTYCNERATATQQTGFSFVSQMRSWLPDPVGGIFWFGVDDAASCVYMPMYCSMTETPEKMSRGYGSMMEFKDDAAFWVFNQVSNFAYTRYNLIHPEIHALQQALEEGFVEKTGIMDELAVSLYEKSPDMAAAFLTDFSVDLGNETVLKWRDFYHYLFTRFMDGNVKEPNPGEQNPRLEQPGYGEDWYRRIVDETGDQFKVVGDSH